MGVGEDVTAFLAVAAGSQLDTSFKKMFVNINPAVKEAASGVVVAGRSGPPFDSKLPDYAYNWVRDASLTMEVVQKLYAAATNTTAKTQYLNILFRYAAARAAEQLDPSR